MPAKVSVIMSVYNEPDEYLQEAIESILNQTFGDFEFIVINDNPENERIKQTLRKYSLKDSRILIIFNKENLGLTKSLNKGLLVAKGKYIARMDANDIAMPGRLGKQVDFMENNAEIGIVGTGHYFINEKGEIIDKKVPPLQDDDLRKLLIKHNTFCHSSIMIRKEVLEKIGFYDDNWKSAQDYELYFRIAKYFKLANLEQPLLYWRVNKDSISFFKSKEQIKNALRAQLKAIKERQYPIYCCLYLIRPITSMIIPCFIKKIIKKYILRRKY